MIKHPDPELDMDPDPYLWLVDPDLGGPKHVDPDQQHCLERWVFKNQIWLDCRNKFTGQNRCQSSPGKNVVKRATERQEHQGEADRKEESWRKDISLKRLEK